MELAEIMEKLTGMQSAVADMESKNSELKGMRKGLVKQLEGFGLKSVKIAKQNIMKSKKDLFVGKKKLQEEVVWLMQQLDWKK